MKVEAGKTYHKNYCRSAATVEGFSESMFFGDFEEKGSSSWTEMATTLEILNRDFSVPSFFWRGWSVQTAVFNPLSRQKSHVDDQVQMGKPRKDVTETSPPKNAKDDSLEQDFQFSTVRKKFVSKHQKRPWFGAMVNHDPKRGFGPFDFNLVSVDFQSHQGAIFPQLFPRKFSPCSCFLDAFFPHKKNPTVFGRFGWKGGTRWYLWDDWAVSSWPWWNCCFRDEQRYIYVIQSEIGITLSHGKDSHEPTSIKECHIYEYVYI